VIAAETFEVLPIKDVQYSPTRFFYGHSQRNLELGKHQIILCFGNIVGDDVVG
jgi:hypothetical protein